jgi:hypothetical protein
MKVLLLLSRMASGAPFSIPFSDKTIGLVTTVGEMEGCDPEPGTT